LVFLSGRGEVERAASLVRSMNLCDAEIVPFFGGMSRSEQEKLFASSGNKRKIVFATNAAQESLTLDINVVIDTCTYKHKVFDPVTGFDFLVEGKAPADHLKQRLGRIGRKNQQKDIRMYFMH
jgi:HrpA-like RNA helicase